MMETGQTLPLGSGTFIAGAFYVAASLFVTGPVVGERTIAKSKWSEQCTVRLRQEIVTSLPEATPLPDLDCQSLLGWMGQRGMDVCRKHGNPALNLPFVNELQAHQRKLNQLKHERLKTKAEGAGSRCACAASVSLEKRRVAWALHAGSLRLITPPTLKNLNAELQAALQTPYCTPKG